MENPKFDSKPEEAQYGLATRALHSGTQPNEWAHSPIMPPLYMTTTFEVRDTNNVTYDYSRSDNPTRTELQKSFAILEKAKYSLAFASGLGAMTTICFLLKSGQRILCGDDVYGGSYRLFSKCLSRMAIETDYVDGTSTRNWAAGFIKGKTKLVWIETPTNPTMKIIDIKATVQTIKALDSECIVVVDNTFITPVYQNPLELGADIVMHSCSKYLSGHSDIIMGAIMTNNNQLYLELKFLQNALGITPSAFDCSQMIRSIKTLEVRVRRQADNAVKIANYLESHPCVDKVIYPGLKSHPQHDICLKQCSGFGGMLSMCIKKMADACGDEATRFTRAVKIFHPAESLGCVCSLIEIPALMTHSSLPEAARDALGITNHFIRLSIGIENVDDLIWDLEQAFKQVYGQH